MVNYRELQYFICLLIFNGCTSTPEVPTEPALPKSQVIYFKQSPKSRQFNDIDVDALIEELGLNQSIETIGYQEREFDTCHVQSNRSPSPHCQNLYLGRINFQVMCRESTGTVEKVRLTPLHTRKLRWKGYKKRGLTQTNRNGFGQVSFISPVSDARGYLYLYLGSRVARKRFYDQWKLILPKSWCTNQ